MSRILFIRHAETDMAGTFCGHSNPTLNARGRTRLSQLLRGLDTEPIHEVYTSDLLRAQETASALAAARSVTLHLRPALREINFGRWEGLTWEAIQQMDKSYAQRWMDEYPNLPAPDGETVCDFEKRVLDEVELLTMRAGDLDTAVVTHAGVLRTVLCRLCECSEDEARRLTADYCSIVRYNVPAMPVAQSEQVNS